MRAKRLYNNTTKDRLCEFVRNGEQPKDVAAKNDVATEVLRRWCRERGITWEYINPSAKYDQNLISEILLEIKADKTTIARASRKHGISAQAISRRCIMEGIVSKGGRKPRKFTGDNLEVMSEMKIAKVIQDLLTGWTRNKELFVATPRIKKYNYVMRHLYD